MAMRNVARRAPGGPSKAEPGVGRYLTAVYTALPTWRMLIFDGILYLSAFAASSKGHRSGMYKFTAAGDGVLHAGFLRQFDDMWRQAHQENGRPHR